MRTVPGRLTVFGVLLAGVCGCTSIPDRTQSEAYIREGAKQWAESVATGDASVLERILADDFVGVDPKGNFYDKATMIANTREAPKYFASNQIGGVRVRLFGNTAVAQGEENWVRHTGERGRFVWTDTWVYRNGSWQIVAAQGASVTAVNPVAATQRAPVEYLNPGKVLPTNLPFSEAVRVGDLLYLSGQIGVLPGTLKLASGGTREEARQAMENIRATLEANGSSMRDVVKCTVMLADMSEWSAFNEVYAKFFALPYPARSALGANGLALGARVEVDCIATALR